MDITNCPAPLGEQDTDLFFCFPSISLLAGSLLSNPSSKSQS